ncbi:MAG: AAA family ATPase, partial [Muribaculaceae bacterium]|nr:AAA family ATPase [Muribaculaceae bacterium]
MFGVSFPELDQLPEDEEGFPDWRKIFDIFSDHIKEINKRQPTERQWELPIKSYIGIFSFTKFLMWHDVHFHPEVIEHNLVLRGLMENHYNPQPNDSEMTNAQSIESESLLDLMMPVDFDSSQLEAVAESHYGSSFVLHGPPGTGKSQTITNMIADALYSGKRILFVAEKKAALDVVRSRLNAIGLEPYCLELHSNKTDKRSFFNQVQKSGIHNLGNHSVSTGKTNGYQITAQTLKSAQNHLSDITKAIHSKNLNGMSLYHCVNQLLSSGYYNLMMDYRDVEHLSPLQIDDLCTEFRSLDLIAEILGYHPGKSDLVGIYPLENTATNQAAVSKALAEMPEAIEKAR